MSEWCARGLVGLLAPDGENGQSMSVHEAQQLLVASGAASCMLPLSAAPSLTDLSSNLERVAIRRRQHFFPGRGVKPPGDLEHFVGMLSKVYISTLHDSGTVPFSLAGTQRASWVPLPHSPFSSEGAISVSPGSTMDARAVGGSDVNDVQLDRVHGTGTRHVGGSDPNAAVQDDARPPAGSLSVYEEKQYVHVAPHAEGNGEWQPSKSGDGASRREVGQIKNGETTGRSDGLGGGLPASHVVPLPSCDAQERCARALRLLQMELAYASHVGMSGVLVDLEPMLFCSDADVAGVNGTDGTDGAREKIPSLGGDVSVYAVGQFIMDGIRAFPSMRFIVRVPFILHDVAYNDMVWERVNQLLSITDAHPSVSVALDLNTTVIMRQQSLTDAVLSDDAAYRTLIDRWIGLPVYCIIVPSGYFQVSNVGHWSVQKLIGVIAGQHLFVRVRVIISGSLNDEVCRAHAQIAEALSVSSSSSVPNLMSASHGGRCESAGQPRTCNGMITVLVVLVWWTRQPMERVPRRGV